MVDSSWILDIVKNEEKMPTDYLTLNYITLEELVELETAGVLVRHVGDGYDYVAVK